jgi:preprotein translocase subunit SecG
MYILVMLIHIIVSLFLIVVVLLQSGKAADLAGAFGGMGSQTAFGPRGSATLLSKATTVSAIVFMLTSLSLSILASRNAGLGTTVLEGTDQRTPAKSAPAPIAPAPVPAQNPAAPMTMTPEGGQPITLPPPSQGLPKNTVVIPAPSKQSATPAPAKQPPPGKK